MNGNDNYDLIVIGAGSGGLVAARAGAQLGAKVALVEKGRIGGDCTWTGCVPSKALLKAARVAHQARTAGEYGIVTAAPRADMARVREYVRRAIGAVYQHETPEQLRREGVEVVPGAARFLDPNRVQAGDRTLRGRNFVIATGARPYVPPILGLADVPFLTYDGIFDNDRLPGRLLIVGAGPVGVEIAQAYQRLGSQAVLIGPRLLPREEPEAAEVLGRVFAREGVELMPGRATSAGCDGKSIVVTVEGREARGDQLLVAAGRRPAIDGLDLDRAGVAHTPDGIHVDDRLRTSAGHIYAAGDCTGGYQFTHFAGWQAFQAVRNALLPGSSRGLTDVVPWTTFTDPEVAHVGLTEADARRQFGQGVRVARWDLDRTDRAVCENDRDGFIKVVHKPGGALLGATVVAGRAGETITEFVVAMQHGLKLGSLADAIHVYPTYSTPVMRMAGDVALADFLGSTLGQTIQRLAGRAP